MKFDVQVTEEVGLFSYFQPFTHGLKLKFMKLIRGGLIAVVAYFMFLYSSINLVSCKKEIIHDTVIVRDTIIDSSMCQACYDLTKGLVAYYNFNGGTLKDSSGNGNHISFNNATPTVDRFGRANNAYLFNGTNNYMSVPNSTSLNPTKSISIVTIFKANGFYSGDCHSNQVLGKGWNDYVNGHYSIRFAYSDGPCSGGMDTSKVYFGAGYGDLNNRAALNDFDQAVHTGRWYHVAFTYEDGVSKIYVNGVLRNTRTSTPLPTFTPNSQELFIGKHGDPPFPYWFNGTVDDVRIYNRGLCEAEVKLLYTSTK